MYSPFKIIHHQDRLDSLKKREPIVPVQVQLIISDLCNQNCHFCAYRDGTKDSWGPKINPKRLIPYDKVIEILNDCQELGVKAIQFTGGGEPTVHPQFQDILRHVVESTSLEFAIVTNGQKINPFFHHATWVRFSIDAATPGTYHQVREVNTFDQVISNLKSFKTKSDGLTLGAGFVVTDENYSEVYDFVKLIHSFVDNIRFSAQFNVYSYPYREQVNKQIRNAIHNFLDVKIFNLFNDRIADGSPDYEFCGYMHFNTYIGADQKIYTCCNNAYTKYGEIGDLNNNRLRDILSIPMDFNAKDCGRCMFNNKNRFINYVLQDNPEHVNFP